MTPEKAPTSLESFVAQADNTRLQSCEDFRRKWTPTEFCTLPSPERRTILRGLLTTSEPISSEPVNGGYNFATEYTPIHEAMPLLYGYGTNKQIAQEAREVFYQNNTFVYPSPWLRHVLSDQANTWILDEVSYPRLHFRSLRILLDHCEPQTTPGSANLDLSYLLGCYHLERLDLEIWTTAESLPNDAEAIWQRLIIARMGIEVVIQQLKAKFGMALKVWIGGPFLAQKKEYIPMT